MTKDGERWAWHYDANGRLIARDLHTPKYRQRVVQSKKAYKRKPKHKGKDHEADRS
jgi:hypothetical protein